MLIGQLAQRSGFTRDTIRFYEKHGLIAVPRKARRENNYKEYPDEALERLLHIKRIKGLGFTLNETQEILDLMDMDKATCTHMSAQFTAKTKAIDEKIAELKALKSTLLESAALCPTPAEDRGQQGNCGLLSSACC